MGAAGAGGAAGAAPGVSVGGAVRGRLGDRRGRGLGRFRRSGRRGRLGRRRRRRGRRRHRDEGRRGWRRRLRGGRRPGLDRRRGQRRGRRGDRGRLGRWHGGHRSRRRGGAAGGRRAGAGANGGVAVEGIGIACFGVMNGRSAATVFALAGGRRRLARRLRTGLPRIGRTPAAPPCVFASAPPCASGHGGVRRLPLRIRGRALAGVRRLRALRIEGRRVRRLSHVVRGGRRLIWTSRSREVLKWKSPNRRPACARRRQQDRDSAEQRLKKIAGRRHTRTARPSISILPWTFSIRRSS